MKLIFWFLVLVLWSPFEMAYQNWVEGVSDVGMYLAQRLND